MEPKPALLGPKNTIRSCPTRSLKPVTLGQILSGLFQLWFIFFQAAGIFVLSDGILAASVFSSEAKRAQLNLDIVPKPVRVLILVFLMVSVDVNESIFLFELRGRKCLGHHGNKINQQSVF